MGFRDDFLRLPMLAISMVWLDTSDPEPVRLD